MAGWLTTMPNIVCDDLFPLRAAELMTQTTQRVTLKVAKQAAIYHRLATHVNARDQASKMDPMQQPLSQQLSARSSPTLNGG